jgi:hypothetical protein
VRQVSHGKDVKVREMRTADTILNIIQDRGKQEATVKETRKPESRMMRQVSSPVRRGAGRKGRKDLARSLPSFKVLRVLFLGEVSSAFLPSKTASWTLKLRHLGVDQQYPGVNLTRGRGRATASRGRGRRWRQSAPGHSYTAVVASHLCPPS